MYNALCCSIFTPDLDVSGGAPGAKSGTAQAVSVVSPPTPLKYRVAKTCCFTCMLRVVTIARSRDKCYVPVSNKWSFISAQSL